MNTETKSLLARLQSIENGDGLRRARTAGRVLWFLGLALSIVVVFSIVYRIHPAAIAIAAAAFGWVIAETNALRTRVAQWPIFRGYIDWKRVHEDLSNEDKEAS